MESSREEVLKRVREAQELCDKTSLPKGVVEKSMGLWKKDRKVYVPDSMKEVVMKEHHDSPLAGHPGVKKTYKLVWRRYWWPSMQDDIKAYIRGCSRCQKTKALKTAKTKILHLHETPEGLWQIVTVDLIGELPDLQGYNAICVLVDHFSKQVHVVPTTTKLTAEGMARIYRDHVFQLYGLPKKIIHDCGTQFDVKMMKELYKLLHIEGNPSTAYHPQTDGQTERVNQELEQYLRLYVNYHQSDWAEWLSLTEFTYNNHEHLSTKVSPFFANSKTHPAGFTEVETTLENLSAKEFATHIKTVHETVQKNLQQAAEDMKRFHDRNAGPVVEYKKGEKVYLDGRNIKMTRPTAKMTDK